MSTKRQGFASLSPEQRRLVSSKGGSSRVPKGFATLSKKERRENAKRAALAMWEKKRKEKEAEYGTIPEGDEGQNQEG